MSRPGAAALILVMSCVFARLPDIDQHLRALLHHRSILTHSILPPLLLLALRDERRRALAAGALAGTATHLAADAAGPAVGYGQVWTPWPVTASLGGLSPLWLAGNAALGFGLALLNAERALGAPRRLAAAAVGGAAGAAALVGDAGVVEAAAAAALFAAAFWASGAVFGRR